MLTGIITAGLVSSFVQAHKTSEWSGYSLAAQAVAMQSLEQAHTAKWVPYANPVADQLPVSAR